MMSLFKAEKQEQDMQTTKMGKFKLARKCVVNDRGITFVQKAARSKWKMGSMVVHVVRRDLQIHVVVKLV